MRLLAVLCIIVGIGAAIASFDYLCYWIGEVFR